MTDLALVRRAAAPLARATIAQHSRSFALASRLLDRRVREQTAVVYAWCRRADDAIDERGAAAPDPPADVLASLARQIDAIYPGAVSPPRDAIPGGVARPAAPVRGEWEARLWTTDPVLAALGDVVRARAIPRAYPRALLAGLAMDAAGTRYATLDELIGYAWRVAGVVGLMMAHVFGVADDGALVHAAHLGIAMQLTNIARDVGEDWTRGRLYLPDELLAAHGAGGLAGDLGRDLPASARSAIARARADLLALADRYYRSGDLGIPALPWRAALAATAARRVYAAIGEQIARTGHDVAAGRAVVPRAARLALVASAVARFALGAPRRIAARRPHRIPTRVLELRDVPPP
jgi:phytoene synthase